MFKVLQGQDTRDPEYVQVPGSEKKDSVEENQE
jgi:hypothetical protein